MAKIVTVVGARPQFVKAAMVSHALAARGGMDEILVHTGQHYDANMSDVFFEELGMARPAYNLEAGSGRHGAQTGAMLGRLEEVVDHETPDCILTYGDTNSTLAAALVAAKANLPIAHVEAGLRSFNRAMPEEVNRIVTDRLSTFLFAPTEIAVEHLRKEGLPESSILLVGDVMYDAALRYGGPASATDIVERLGLSAGGYVLATIHRAENTDDPTRLAAITAALTEVSAQIPIVLPLHPRTRSKLGSLPSGIRTIAPVGYVEMLALERGARVIATDSGGVQKEAFFNGVPCVTFRTETEWVELVTGGWNRLADPANRSAMTEALLAQVLAPSFPDRPADLYGGGQAAERIANKLGQAFAS